jgi:quercetin dioxygenase-like cupin family protein
MSKIHRHIGNEGRHDWEGVEASIYTADTEASGATRRILIGQDEGAENFVLRYFEIPPDGASSLDRHAHDHGIYVLTGRATLTLEGETHSIGPGDVIYVGPNEQHQFRADKNQTFGFLCVVPPSS